MFLINRYLRIDKIHSIRAVTTAANRYFNGSMEKPNRKIRSAFTLSTNSPLISNLNPCKFSLNSKRPFSTVRASLSLEKVSKDHNSRILSFYLKHDDGRMEEYALPYSWLRDVCQCSECFNHNSVARIQLMKNFNLNCSPQEVTLNSDNKEILIKWENGHKGSYPIDFLRKRNFAKEGDALRKELFEIPHKLPWSTELQGRIKRFNFKDLIECDHSLLSFLEEICVSGIVLIEDCPKDTHNYLVPRVSYEEATCYGTEFTIISKTTPSNLAYTSNSLNLHSDLAFYSLIPGVQVFHCISQDDNILGGENQFADALHCSMVLKEKNKLHYDMLTTQLINRYDYGSDFLDEFHFQSLNCTLELDHDGLFKRINYSDQTRDTFQNEIPLKKVDDYYKALKALDSVEHKMKSGETVVFDNQRVLHARKSFEVKGESERHLHGWYWRWDEVHSRMRRLKGKITGRSII